MTPDLQLLLVIGGGLSLLLIVLALFWPSDGDDVKKRLERVSGKASPQKKDGEVHHSIRRVTQDSNIPWFDKFIKTCLPNPEKLRSRLEQTGTKLTLGVYLLINGLTVMTSFLVLFFIVGWSRPSSLLMGIAIGLYLPHAVIGKMGSRRLNKFLATFPEAIDTICRGLRSGLPITESIGAVGRELPDPIGIEFRRISDGVRMGRPVEDAMWEVSKRLESPEFRFFIIAMAIQKETGGNLAETLGNLSDLLRKRRQLRMKVRAMSSEARASAMIIGSLPFLMMLLLFVIKPDYIGLLFTDPKGKLILGGAGFMMALGIFVMKKMVNFEL